jgi:PAS domain S-box-containing protein
VEFFAQLFSNDFMPHGTCYLWDPRILWLHVISDGLIALSYYCIPLILFYFIRKHRELPFNRIFWMFGTFILACGTTHLIEIWNVWHAHYLIAGIGKAITAGVSVMTVAMLILLIPQIISLPAQALLREQNRDLKMQIAERKQFEEVRERLAAVVESSEDAIISMTLNGTITAWNPGAERLFGYSPTEATRKPIRMIFPPERASEECDILSRIGRGERVNHFETVRVRKDGEHIDVSTTISPIKNSSGRIIGASKIARDITQRRFNERKIRELNDELELRVAQRTALLLVANEELESFSYSVSHDLRAPLRHIGGFSKLLIEEFGPSLDPVARGYVERIQAGAHKMGVLVDELLNLARVGRHPLNLHPCELNALVTETLTILKPDIDINGREVEWRIAELPVAECDCVLVKQVFQNLLANALKFTRPRAHAVIEVSCKNKDEDGQTVFMVRDNGVGFSMKYVDKLFGVFQRLHNADQFEGTGIGLATVQRIVRKHGGRVWAEGETDRGAAFYFTLGAGKQTEPQQTAIAAGG